MFNFTHPVRKEEELRLMKENRLPPGQALTLKFPVLHYGPVPVFNPATWDFRVWGEVEEERAWTWEEFNKLPRTSIKLDIHCVTRWSKADTTWEGVSVRTLVEHGLIKLTPAAKYRHAACRIRIHGQPAAGSGHARELPHGHPFQRRTDPSRITASRCEAWWGPSRAGMN